MTSVTALLDILRRHLKSDAVPKPPRQNINQNEEVPGESPRVEDIEGPQIEAEEILIEDNDLNKEGFKPKKNFFKTNTKKTGCKDPNPETNDLNDPNKNIIVNTQATGHVINILNSKDVQWGNNYVYNMGPTRQKSRKSYDSDSEEEEEVIVKDNNITLLLEAKEDVEHEYRDYISKNLGRNWRSFIRSLGYTKKRIETFECDEGKNGVSEVRYKLLLDWVRNADDPSLGHLSTRLWDEGERDIVKALSIIYKKNKISK